MDHYLTPAEQSALLNAARLTNTRVAQRDYHLMCALILTGCRIGEFLQITLLQTCTALKTGYLFIPKEHRKGQHADVSVYLSVQLRAHLTALVDAHGADEDACAPLIIGRNGEHLTVRAVQKRVKVWAQAAGIHGNVSPHWFRHTHAMNILRTSTAKNPLSVVQKALGHISIASTGIYAHATREELQADQNRAASALDAALHGKRRVTLAQLRRAHQTSIEEQTA